MDRHFINSMGRNTRLRQSAGFSMVELALVVLVIFAISGIALLNVNAILPGMRTNKAMYMAMAELRRGRELAITQRRRIELRFVGVNEIQLLRIEEPSHSTTIVDTATMDNHCEFMRFSEVGDDTPDGFGSGSAVSFGGATKLIFSTDGTLVNQSGDPVSGTVSIGIAGHPEVARAVTVLGATGRIKSYRWTGIKWIP